MKKNGVVIQDFLRSARLYFLIGVASAFATATHATTTVAGIEFEDNAFADRVILASPLGFTIVGGAASLEDAVTGSDVESLAFNATDGALLTLGFTDNHVVNGPGDDLVYFEATRTSLDPIVLTIGGVQVGPQDQTPSGFFNSEGFSIGLTFWDLSDFGIAAGGRASEVTVQGLCLPTSAETFGCTEGELIAVATMALGALNSATVPLPASGWMLTLALAGLVARARRSV